MQKVGRAEILGAIAAITFLIGTAMLPFFYSKSGDGLPPCGKPAFGIPCDPQNGYHR